MSLLKLLLIAHALIAARQDALDYCERLAERQNYMVETFKREDLWVRKKLI